MIRLTILHARSLGDFRANSGRVNRAAGRERRLSPQHGMARVLSCRCISSSTGEARDGPTLLLTVDQYVLTQDLSSSCHECQVVVRYRDVERARVRPNNRSNACSVLTNQHHQDIPCRDRPGRGVVWAIGTATRARTSWAVSARYGTLHCSGMRKWRFRCHDARRAFVAGPQNTTSTSIWLSTQLYHTIDKDSSLHLSLGLD